MTQINRLFSQPGVSRPAVGGGGGDTGVLNRGISAVSQGLSDLNQRQERMQAQRDEFWARREQQRFDRDMLETMTALGDASPEDGAGYRQAVQDAYQARLASSLDGAPSAMARDRLKRNVELAAPDFDEALFGAERGMMRDYTAEQISQIVDDGSQALRREVMNGPEVGRSAVAERIASVESGGKLDAVNPNSSATGKYQFVRSTWLEQIKRYRPDVAEGKSDDEVWALATDEALQDEMEGHFRNENVRHLAANGIDADAGAVYLAHFAGRGGAVKALKASPDTPISKVMSKAAIEANASVDYNGKDFKDFTAGDLVDWSRAKMGQDVSRQKDVYGVPIWNGPTPTPEKSVTYQEALADVDDLLAVMPGTRAQKKKLKRAAKTQMVKTWMAGLAETSPSQAMAALRSGKYDDALSVADDAAVEGIAATAYSEFERKIAAQQAKIETARKEQQALTASLLRVEVQNGEASEAEVDAAFAQGEISHQSWATQRIAAMGVREQNAEETRKLNDVQGKARAALLEVGVLSGEVGADDLMEAVKSGQIPITAAPDLLSKILKRDGEAAKATAKAGEKAAKSAKDAADAAAKVDEKQAKRLRGVIGGRALTDAYRGVYDVARGEELVLAGNMSEADHQQAIGIQEGARRTGTGKEEKERAAQDAVIRAYDSGIPPDMTDTNIRDAVDATYRAQIEASENPVVSAAVFVERMNVIPDAMKSDIARAMMGDDAEARRLAMDMTGAVLAQSPEMYGEFSRSDKHGSGLKAAVAATSLYEQGMAPEAAVEQARDALSRTTAQEQKRKDEFRTGKLGEKAFEDLADALKDADGTFWNAGIDPSISGAYQDRVQQEYLKYGDMGAATAVAKTEFLRRHAVTNIGARRWQRDAPEKIYGIWGDGRDTEWIKGQSVEFLKGQEIDGFDPDNIILHTASSPREQPYYVVLFENEDGVMTPAQGAFRPDPSIARAAADATAATAYQSDSIAVKEDVAAREKVRQLPRIITTRDLARTAKDAKK